MEASFSPCVIRQNGVISVASLGQCYSDVKHARAPFFAKLLPHARFESDPVPCFHISAWISSYRSNARITSWHIAMRHEACKNSCSMSEWSRWSGKHALCMLIYYRSRLRKVGWRMSASRERSWTSYGLTVQEKFDVKLIKLTKRSFSQSKVNLQLPKSYLRRKLYTERLHVYGELYKSPQHILKTYTSYGKAGKTCAKRRCWETRRKSGGSCNKP